MPRILYVTHRFPDPPDKGDRIRNGHVLRYLCGLGEVWLATLADEAVPAVHQQGVEALVAGLHIAPVGGWGRKAQALVYALSGQSLSEGMFASPALRTQIRAWSAVEPFDLAVASSSAVASYILDRQLRVHKRIVDLVDVDSQKWADYAAASRIPQRWLYQHEAARVRQLESRLCQQADGLMLVGDAETELFRKQQPGAPVKTVTNGVDLDYYRPVETNTVAGLAFVGAFDYKPNVDGAVWFVEMIWPGLKAANAGLTLHLVGRNPAPAVQALARHEGVIVTGSVPDVRPYVARAACVIAPLRIARGLQNKVLEAWAMGKPVVASPAAIGGFNPQTQPPALVARDTDEWHQQIQMLLNDEARQRAIGLRGRAYAERHHAWHHCLAALGDELPAPLAVCPAGNAPA
jgi:polysaccharide biosynthesis protein PslH